MRNRNRIRKLINTKQFHIGVILLIVFIILSIAGIIALKYTVEGEANLPFVISKISIVSSVEGTDNVEDTQNRWNLKVNQNNDIYLYIKKNEQYQDTEIIENIRLDNFVIKQAPRVGNAKLFKPNSDLTSGIFVNNADNEVNSIKYTGEIDSSIKDMKITNQGGLVVFRYAITELGDYISNDDKEINHDDLLKKLSINNEDLKFDVTFDIIMNLNSKKSFKANVDLELPIGDVVNGGVQSEEKTDLKDIVFKRN